MSHPARDATKDGIPRRATGNAVRSPAARPQTRTSGMVTQTGRCQIDSDIAAMAPRNPERNPTERSMCRMTMTSVMPTARTAM